MRAWRGNIFFVLVLAAVAAACSEEPESATGPAVGLSTSEVAGPGLAIYGIGAINRAIPRPCPEPEYREFDFWVGKWDILNPQDDKVGTSIVTSELDGCVIMEDFIGSGGMRGRSMSVYDADLHLWFQRFVDNVVTSLRVDGGKVGDEMILTGSHPYYNFATGIPRQRDTKITWTPNADGSVHQLFENSFDGGPVEPGFDGLYIHMDPLDRADPFVLPFCQFVLAGPRQLDFWLGDWTVATANGAELGGSKVISDLNGCLIEENFQTPKGYQNRSFLFYDFVVDTWFRSFADNNGEHVELTGGLVDGKMVLTGTDIAPDGREVELRATIEPLPSGQVRQTWELSHDGGATWKADLSLVYTSL
jgi:hypothetical protein